MAFHKVREAFRNTGKFLRRHSGTIKTVVGIAATAGALLHGRHVRALEHARHQAQAGSYDWYVNQPDVRAALDRRNQEASGPAWMGRT